MKGFGEVQLEGGSIKTTRAGGYGGVVVGLLLLLVGCASGLYAAGGLSPVWTGLMLLAGLVLLFLEAFVIPGFGAAGVSGIVLLAVATVAAIVPDGANDPLLTRPLIAGLTLRPAVLLVGGSAAMIGVALLTLHAPRLPFLSKLTLPTPDGASLALRHPHPHSALVGDVGEVIADLRPAGRARFGAEVVDVSTRGEYVSTGIRVEVLKREGAAIIVRPLPAPQEPIAST